MAFIHGKSGVALLGKYNLSTYLSAMDWSAEVDLPDTTTLGSNARRRQVVGLKDATVTLTGFHDAVAGLNGIPQPGQIICNGICRLHFTIP